MNADSPDDDTLRAFLLGLLPPVRAEAVREWLDADPTRAARLARLGDNDPLTDALRAPFPTSAVPEGTIDRVLGVVRAQLTTPAPGFGDTPNATLPGTGAPAVSPVWPPARLGQFRIVGELGHGGMGYVFEAEDEKLGRRVAVKVLHPDLTRLAGAAERFLREARAAAKVEHANVVPILHVGEDAGTPFMVMPLLKGEPLDKRLKRGPLPPAEVARVGREIATGLGAAHARGLVHRDMKPANVWLDESGRALVFDFGLARHGDGRDALTEAGALQGTPAYMAPEQIDGSPPNPRVDMFALGAILYECATGIRAFAGETVTAVLKAVATHDPVPPATVNPSVPASLSELIVRLLAKAPTARPASAEEVALELARVPTAPDSTRTWEGDAAPANPRRPRTIRFQISCAVTVCLLIGVSVVAITSFGTNANSDFTFVGSKIVPPVVQSLPTPPRYTGGVDVRIERDGPDGKAKLYRLNEPGALPMRPQDKFAIEAEVDPPAFVYLLWVDPGADVTGVYPWSATADDWKGTRPKDEQKVSRVRLPETAGNYYRAWDAKPGLATVVLLARATPLDASDADVAGWFKALPPLELSNRSETAAVWHRDFLEVHDPLRLRAGFTEVGSSDPFARWQGALQTQLKGRSIGFQATVSFARTCTTK
jgi:serine/threonine protein kinase